MLRTMFGLVFWLSIYIGIGYVIYSYWYLPKFSRTAEIPSQERIWNVRAAKVQLQDFEITRSFLGSIQSRKLLRLSFRIAGCISEIHVDLDANTVISKDTLIASFDDSRARLNKAEAERTASWYDARIREADIELSTRLNALARARDPLATVESQLARQKALFEKNLSTISAFEDAERRLRSGKETASAAQDAVSLARASLDSLVAERQIHDTKLEQISIALADYQLRAPRTLRIISNNISIGSCVSPDIPVLEGFEVGDLEVLSKIPRIIYNQLTRTNPLIGKKVKLDGLGFDCLGQIRTIEFGERKSDLMVRLSLPDHCQQGFVLNAPVTFDLPFVQLHQAMRLPIAAEHERNRVFVIDQGTLTERHVETRLRDGKWLYVSGGLLPGEKVLISGADFAIDGLKVRIVEP